MIVTRSPKELDEVVTNHPDSTVVAASRPVSFFDKLIFGFKNFGRNTNQVDAYAKIIFPFSYIIATIMYCLWVASIEDFDQRNYKRP